MITKKNTLNPSIKTIRCKAGKETNKTVTFQIRYMSNESNKISDLLKSFYFPPKINLLQRK